MLSFYPSMREGLSFWPAFPLRAISIFARIIILFHSALHRYHG